MKRTAAWIAALTLVAVGWVLVSRHLESRRLDKQLAVAEESHRERLEGGFAALAAGNVAEAIDRFETLLGSNPVDPEARLGLAVALADEGRTLEAKATIRGLQRSFEDPNRRRLLAQLWAEMGEWDQMISVLAATVHPDQDDLEPILELVRLADSEGDWQGVVDLTEPLLDLELAPDLARDLRERRAGALLAVGRLNEAADLLAAVPSQGNLHLRAELALRLNRLPQAEALYRRLVELEPENDNAARNLAASIALQRGRSADGVEIVLMSSGATRAASAASPPMVDEATADARRFLAVEMSGQGAEASALLRTDGSVPYSTTALDRPYRFIVDLHGVLHESPRRIQEPDMMGVRRIRTTQYRRPPQPVVRVVFDLDSAQAATVIEVEGGLGVRFSPVPDLLMAQSPAPEPRLEALPALEPREQEPRAAEPLMARPPLSDPAVSGPLTEESAFPKRWRVRSDLSGCLSMRTGPATTESRIDCLLAGSDVRPLQVGDGWTQVELPDRRSGWVATRFLEQPPSGATDQQEKGPLAGAEPTQGGGG